MNSVPKYQIIFYISLVLGSIFCSNSNECGESKGNISSFPWNVGIYLKNQNQLELSCFGSIIHTNAILTAAHCLCENLNKRLRNTTFYVTKNILNEKVSTQAIPKDFYEVSKDDIVLHKYYAGLTDLYLNDIAIIKGKIGWNGKTKPVCVDWSDEIIETNYKGKQPIWDGAKIQIIDQSYLDFDECTYSAPKTFIAFITEDKTCIKIDDPRSHLTHTSEGAGLVFFNSEDKRWYIRGVISMHEITKGKLSTYTSLKQNINWISNIYATL